MQEYIVSFRMAFSGQLGQPKYN
uniref:Uncharacterized protein n=1 Tax=Arundo donax TaxID=35708 RepID=A0A0A9F6I3_ARUDO